METCRGERFSFVGSVKEETEEKAQCLRHGRLEIKTESCRSGEQSSFVYSVKEDREEKPQCLQHGRSKMESCRSGEQSSFVGSVKEEREGKQHMSKITEDPDLWSSCLDQQRPELLQIKEEEEEQWISQEGEQLTYRLQVEPEIGPVKRHAYQAEFKLKAISHAIEHGNRAAARKFNVNESMVRKWRKQEDALRNAKKTKQSFRGNKARWPQLEDKVHEWVIEQRTTGRSVSTLSIRLQATAVAHDMNIDDFRGGPSWCFRFMRRRSLFTRTRTTVSQQLSKDHEQKLAIFRTHCKNRITEKRIQPQHITNMDEVPLTFDIPWNLTVERKGTSAGSLCTTGNKKLSFTVVLGCQADGKKLPPVVIFKSKTLPKERFLPGVIIKADQKGWMDKDKMSEWLREVYVRRPDGFFHQFPSILICDSMPAHLTDTVRAQVKQINSELAIVPVGLTKELQPLNLGVSRSFKVKLRAVWERWMSESEHAFSKTGRQRRVSYATICQWIADAWAKVSVSTVVRAFTKAGILTEQQSNNSESDSDNDADPGNLDAKIAQLFMSDTEDEDFDGFMEDE